jgi:hypothetical protein
MPGELRKRCGPSGERSDAEWIRTKEKRTELTLLRSEHNMMTEAKRRHCGANMQYSRPNDEHINLVLSDDEPAPHSEFSAGVPLRIDEATPGPPPPQQPQAVSTPKKAMAASVPGSEYWLP